MLTSEWSRMGGKQAALQLLSQQKRPTAIFAASDMQAVGVLEAANLPLKHQPPSHKRFPIAIWYTTYTGSIGSYTSLPAIPLAS